MVPLLIAPTTTTRPSASTATPFATFHRILVRSRPELVSCGVVGDSQDPTGGRSGGRSDDDDMPLTVDNEVCGFVVAVVESVLDVIPEELSGGVPGESQEIPPRAVPNPARRVDVAVRTLRDIPSLCSRVDQAAVPARLPAEALRRGRGGGDTGRQRKRQCGGDAGSVRPGPERLHDRDPSRKVLTTAGVEDPALPWSRSGCRRGPAHPNPR